MVQLRRLTDPQLVMAQRDAQARVERTGSLSDRDALRELTDERARRDALVHSHVGLRGMLALCGVDGWSRMGSTQLTTVRADVTCPECIAKLAPLPVAVRWVR